MTEEVKQENKEEPIKNSYNMDKLIWHNEKRKIDDLIPTEGNPRQMTEKQKEDLQKSLEKFNLVEIPAINTDNRIISGHQRLKVLQLLGRGKEEIDVRVPNRTLTEEEHREYLLRANKNLGEWDFDLLANFNEDLLKDVGWDSEELQMMFGLNDIDDFEVDFDRYNVLMINPPGGVKLKERILLNCKNKYDYDLVKRWVLENGDSELVNKILDIIK